MDGRDHFTYSPISHVRDLVIRWTLRPRDPRAIFTALLIQRISFGHIACIKKLEWNIVPHGEKKGTNGYIRCDVLRGLASFVNRDAYMYYNPILRVNKYTHVSYPRHVGACVGPRGSATWPCVPRRIHVAPTR